jgi:hypothetical protein
VRADARGSGALPSLWLAPMTVAPFTSGVVASRRGSAGGSSLAQMLGNQNPMLLLSLSLNLMLLAVFVVLGASADLDRKRVDLVLTSVQRSFGRPAADDAEAGVRASRERMIQDALRSSVSEAFKSVLQGEDVVVRREADRVAVAVPEAALFDAGTGGLRAALPVLDRLVGVLNAPPAEVRYELIVTLPDRPSQTPDAAAKAGLLAQDLSRRGLQPGLLSVGMIGAARDLISFTFVVSAEPDPRPSPVGGP